MGALEGPDIGVRVVTADSLADLGAFGLVILGGSTPRTALQCAASALPRYSTHELLNLWRIPGGLCVRAGWSLAIDDETMHLTQQFTARLVLALCATTGLTQAKPRSVRIRAHPEFGLNHLRPWFGPALGVATEATLDIDLDDDVLDAPLRLDAARTEVRPPQDWVVLKEDSSFSHSARLVLKSITGDPRVSIERLARAAGMSVRSLQRALTSEGTSFRQLSDELRRVIVLEALPAAHGTLVGRDRPRLCGSIFHEPRGSTLDGRFAEVAEWRDKMSLRANSQWSEAPVAHRLDPVLPRSTPGPCRARARQPE